MALDPLEILKKQAELQAQINEGAEGYFKLIKDIGNVERNLADLRRQQVNAINSGNHAYAAQLQVMIDDLTQIRTILTDTANTASKTAIAFKLMGKSISAVPGLLQKGFGSIKGSGLFEMDKSIKMAGLEMGILSKQTDTFRKSILNSALGVGKTGKSTIELGISIQDLAKMQADYSNEIGRSIQLSDEGNQAMAELAKGTALGSEGAAQMAADMDMVGKSAGTTRDFVEQTMNDAHKMGLNASKVIKNIQSNFKLLNKYNFKHGTKGLAAMAEDVTKMGVSMDLVSGMAEKLFDIEGAVEMSAQLQVLGGAWSKLADPFKLMYLARNDMEGLTKSIIEATKGSAQFNKENGEFDISALELQRLRKVAEAAGLDYEQLAQSAKNAAKYAEIGSQIRIDVDDDTKKFIENTGILNNKKEATIQINGVDKLVKSLSQNDLIQIKIQAKETAKLREMAKNSQNFDDALNNTFTLMKTALLPVIQEINEKLIPLVTDFFNDKNGFKSSLIEWGKKAADLVGGIVSFVGKVGSFIIEFPKLSASLLASSYVLFEGAKWITNGMALGVGFNTVTGGQGGGLMQMASGFGKMAGIALAGAAAVGLGALISNYVGKGYDKLFGEKKKSDNWSDNWGKKLGRIGTMTATGAGVGAGVGTVFGGLGAVPGAVLGGVGGLGKGLYDEFVSDPVNDGIIGSDFSKGRGIIQGGKITPIDNNDDLLAMKPKGIIDKAINNSFSQDIKIEFGELRFKFDELKISSPGNPSVAIDLVNNPEFIRNITRMIHVETNKAINGGKITPHPTGK